MNNLSVFRTPPTHKTFGIEIEGIVARMAQYIPDEGDFIGFFKTSSDGSIRAWPTGYGREFVSQPLTYEWLLKEIPKLYKKVYAFSWNDSCGIHIHVNKQWCSKKKSRAIQKFVCSLSKEDFYSFFGRFPNNYCRQDVTRTRYCAVNTTREETTEFRMFRSGNAEWAKYCVKMARYLVENAYHLNVDALEAFWSINYPENTL